MFTHAAVLRRTSFDCSPRSCLRVRDDPTPPTPPSSNSIWRACVREAECTCFHVPVSPIVHTIVCRSLARCARGDSEHRTTFGSVAAKHAQERCVRGLSCSAEFTLHFIYVRSFEDTQVKRTGLHKWLRHRTAKMCPFNICRHGFLSSCAWSFFFFFCL